MVLRYNCLSRILLFKLCNDRIMPSGSFDFFLSPTEIEVYGYLWKDRLNFTKTLKFEFH